MSTAEEQLYAALSASTSLATVVGQRIWPDAIPEGRSLPAVVFSRTGTDPVISISGARICEDVQFQIVAWAETRADADAAAAAIESAVRTGGQVVSGRSANFDAEMGLFAATVEATWFISF